MNNLQAIVLAAGKSTRLKSGRNKLLEKICGQEMVLYSIKLLEALSIPCILVVGSLKQEITKLTQTVKDLEFVEQQSPLGTGHAVQITQELWKNDHILIMNGDMPLVDQALIKDLYDKHIKSDAAISFVTAHNEEPNQSYGRVIKENGIVRIAEAADFQANVHEHCCINAGIYIVKRSFLQEHINTLTNHNAQKQFYITDLVQAASSSGQIVTMVEAAYDTVRGVNTYQELWAVEQIKRGAIISNLMANGVRFISAQTVHLELDVHIGAGTIIGTGVQLKNGTIIEENCTIGDFCIIDQSFIAQEVVIESHSVIKCSTIASHAQIGPFAHIREHSSVGKLSTVGNFVELKKTTFGKHSKAKHLSYLGDATVGERVNIGAGTITCNHDGVNKNPTIIKDDAYIGSNNSLVAPVTIGNNGYTAAGSTITEDVPAKALAIARARQINKQNYVQKLKDKQPTTTAEKIQMTDL